jgi:hypothetical protein
MRITKTRQLSGRMGGARLDAFPLNIQIEYLPAAGVWPDFQQREARGTAARV